MGFHQPDAGGEIFFKGKRIDDWSVARARALGIETVYQERALCEKQPIWRNMFMGREPRTKWGLLDVKRMKEESARLMSEHMGFTSAAVHPDNVVTTMSGGEKQGVAITRALYFDAQLVILDEPTMGLSLTETKKTLDFVNNIKKAGKSAIFIDHNIFHVYPVVDRLYVLDRGKVAGRLRQVRHLDGRPHRPALPRRAVGLAGVGAMAPKSRPPSRHGQAADNRVAPPSLLRRYGSQLGIIGVGIVMWLAFVIAAPTVFTNIDIYVAFAQTTPVFGIIALALTFVVITGEIDLSFPSIMALGTAVFCLGVTQWGLPWYAALVAAFATGAVCGWINGALVARLNIPSLVITIGTQFLFRGLELVLMNGTGVPLTEDLYPELHDMLREPLFGVLPIQSVWMVVLAVLMWLLLNRTRFGAHVFLVGDNPTSARLMGINVAVGQDAGLRARRRAGRARRADDLDLRLLFLADDRRRLPAHRHRLGVSWAAPRCSAAPARSSARSSPPSSSARSMPASSRPASTPSTRSWRLGW